MRSIPSFAAALVLVAPAAASAQDSTKQPLALNKQAQVRIFGVHELLGRLIVIACARPMYPDHCDTTGVRGRDLVIDSIRPSHPETTINITFREPQLYVFRVIDDVNGNGYIDPGEPEAFSRGATRAPGGGLPSFDQAAVNVTSYVTDVVITLPPPPR